MSYKPELGIIGNIERCERLTNEEASNRTAAVADANTQMEIARTDAELNNIEAQQLITELDLRVMELEGN